MFEVNVEELEAPLFIAWQLNSACNLDCLHCCEEAGQQIPGELNYQEVLNFIQQIIEARIPYAAISGGEPMLHPHFFEICRLISQAEISLKVETNGHFINQEAAQQFKLLNFRSVQISLDGANPQTHEKMRQRGDWHRVVAACRLLLSQGVPTEIVFVPTKFNYQEVGEMIDLAKSLGVYGFYTGKIMRIGRAARNWDILNPTEEEYQSFFKVLQAKTNQYNGQMKIYYYPYDVIEELKYRLGSPAASLLVLPNGKVKLIGPLPFICGDLKKQTLLEIWQNYKKAWKDQRVVEFAQKVIADPRLLAESNHWVELN